MGVQNPQTMDISLVALDGVLAGGNIPIPDTTDTDYLFNSMYLPSSSPLVMKAYYPEVVKSKYTVQNYNNAYPGLEWSQLFEVLGGNGPIIYEIVQAPSGMTIGSKLTRDTITGYFVPDSNYSILRWNNPVAGRYRVAIRATDQIGQKVHWIWDLFVGTANHFFMDIAASGTGLGTSPSNYASYANTFLGSVTTSPAQGKVLHIKGSTYPSTTERIYSNQYMSSSWVAMPAENPIFRSKVKVTSDNWYFNGIVFQAINTDQFGIIGSDIGVNNFSVVGCLFDECTVSGITNNQSCIGFTRAGEEAGRENIVVSNCEFKNSPDLHGFDYYRIKDHKFSRNKLTITNGSTLLTRSWIFPKQEVYNSDIEYNTANIPSVSGGTVSVAQLYNSVVGGSPNSSPMVINFRNNYINVGGGVALQLQQDEGTTSNTVNFDNYVTRNTIVGGGIQIAHWVSDGKPNRRIFMESNIIQNADGGAYIRDGGVTPPVNTTDWLFESGINKKGTSGLVDSDGHLINTTDRGKTGHGIWKP